MPAIPKFSLSSLRMGCSSPPSVTESKSTNSQNIGVRSLNKFEQSRIDKAIEKAFDMLPARLVAEMANIPPASPEVAKLYGTSVEELKTHRNTAVGMITLHTVMEQVIETRNRHWTRDERERMSDRIDAYARQAILRELDRHRRSGLQELKKRASSTAQKGVAQHVIGVSEREAGTLFAMSAYLMKACLDTSQENGGITEAQRDDYGNHLSVEEARQVYLALDPAMVEAFTALFAAYDEKVRKGSLAGVDHGELNELDAFVKNDGKKTPTNHYLHSWMKDQGARLSKALNDTCATLPEHIRSSVRNAYVNQFLRPYDLNFLAPPAAALWKIRDDRRQQAAKAKAEPIARADTDAWVEQAMNGLRALMEEYDGGAVPGSTSAAAGEEQGPGGGDSEITQALADGSRAARFKGTMSDLRAASEGNRSGVPWRDTRVQESMEKIAAPGMKELLPQHRAGTLDALAAYGKPAAQFLMRKRGRIKSMPKSEAVISKEELDKMDEATNKQRGTEPPRFKFIPRQADAGFRIWNSTPSYVSRNYYPSTASTRPTFSDPEVVISPADTWRTVAMAQHELGHAFDAALNSRRETNKANHFYSGYNSNVIEERDKAAREKTGITRYAETNVKEFFAESMSAYPGMPNAYYMTNVKKENVDVYSPENLQEQHPKTFAVIDELVRSGFDRQRAERSLAGKTSMGDKLKRRFFNALGHQWKTAKKHGGDATAVGAAKDTAQAQTEIKD